MCKSMYILKMYSKKYLRTKQMVQKKALFFHLRTPTHHIFTVNLRLNLSTRFVSLKLCVGISIFDSVLYLLKSIFLLHKIHGFHSKLKKIEKLHTALLPDLWFLSCNKKFQNSVISAWVGAPQKPSWWQIF